MPGLEPRDRNWGRMCECIILKTKQERSGMHQLKSSLAAALAALLGAKEGTGKAAGLHDYSVRWGKQWWPESSSHPACPTIFPDTSNPSVSEESVDSDTFLMKPWSLIIAAETNIDG